MKLSLLNVQIIVVIVTLMSIVLSLPIQLINVILLVLTMTDVARRVYIVSHFSAVVVGIR